MSQGMTAPHLERARRDCEIAICLAATGSPAALALTRQIEQIDQALAAMGSPPAVQPGPQAG